jgi:hypothetical protein
MPSWIEFRLAVHGVLRLARFNPDFPRFFDLSPRGALRSFWIALPLYPYYLLQIWPVNGKPDVPDLALYVVAMSVGYLYLWLVPPCVLTWIAPLIGRRAEMPGCIAVYNWTSLLWLGISWPLLMLSYADLQEDLLGILGDVLTVISLVWEVFLLMRTLRLALWQAGIATIADYFVMQRLVLPMFYLAAIGS